MLGTDTAIVAAGLGPIAAYECGVLAAVIGRVAAVGSLPYFDFVRIHACGN